MSGCYNYYMNPQQGEKILNILKERNQKISLVTLNDGKVLKVFNITWDRDIGDEYDHITTNISPGIEGEQFDFFFTKDVKEIETPENEKLL